MGDLMALKEKDDFDKVAIAIRTDAFSTDNSRKVLPQYIKY